jgi:predicted nucleic acid-binding protein
LIGIDTDFLVAYEDSAHPLHGWSRSVLAASRMTSVSIVIAPQVIAEYVHVVTDARRFESPLSMQQALDKVEEWRTAKEVVWTSADNRAIDLFLSWMAQFQLGRKRVLDTLLAATYAVAGVSLLATLNRSDFECFGVFNFPEQPDS